MQINFKHILLFTIVASFLIMSGCASLDEDETKDWTPQRFYVEAKEAMEAGQYDSAIKNYETLEARFPYGRYAEQAQLEVGYAYFKNEEPELAIAAAERFIRLHPTHPHVAYAYYFKGIIYFNEKKSFLSTMFDASTDATHRNPKAIRSAFNSFRELVERFPDSRYTADASRRLAYLFDAQARYEINVAKFYFKKEAYIATVNRTKTVLKKYQRSPVIEDALWLQLMSYQKMGLNTLKNDTLRILQVNFPKSKYLIKHLSMPESDEEKEANG
ncbi:MAG: outer membrane protein assembly factor BamD [Acidiferrobacterales bacterium]